MSEEENKILKNNHGEKSMKHLFTIYPDLDCLLEKTDTCQNDPQTFYTEKKISIKLLVIQCLDNVYTVYTFFI